MSHTSANPGKANPQSKSATRQRDILDAKGREEMISVAAYFRAEHRGFGGGDALNDWLAAEAEIDAMDSRIAIKAH
jgi:hypothetical protein